MVFRVTAYEHVGIRVSDRQTAISFYEKLGWREVVDLPEHQANEMINDAGVYINLIFNGVGHPQRNNILQDAPIKYPGFTHAAFVIEDLNNFLAMLKKEAIQVTDGPVIYSNRRKVVFIRDPDGNVLEFNELLTAD